MNLDQCRKQHLFGAAAYQARSELAQHGAVESGITQFKAQRIFAIDPAAHCVGSLPIGEISANLNNVTSARRAGCFCRLSALRKQARKLLIQKYLTEFIGDSEPLGNAAEATCRVCSGIAEPALGEEAHITPT